MITKEKWDALEKRMQALDILESEIEEKFILGSGSGGQKINKTHSCVYIKHTPSGFEIKCQQERSRDANRFFARRMLCEKIEERDHKEISAIVQKREKIRRQKKRRSRRSQEKMLSEKKELSEKKNLRKPPIEP